MASLFQLDEKTKQLLTLDNFLDGMTIQDFVEYLASKLSERAGYDGAQAVDQLDPKPYIRTFEACLKELNKLSEDCLSKKSKFEKIAEVKQTDHYSNVLKLAPKANKLNTRFVQLDSQVSQINADIKPLGDKLTQTNNLKENTVTLIFLTKCYNEFYTKKQAPAELAKMTRDRKASTLNRLLELSSKISSNELPNAKLTHQLIQEYCNRFEIDLLNEFHELDHSKNYRRLQELSHLLFLFNDGENLKQFYINKHPIFNEFQTTELNVDANYWQKMSDPEFTQGSLDGITKAMLDAIEDVLTKAEYDAIRQIFLEYTKDVIVAFVDRFYNDLLRNRVQLLMRVSSSYSRLASLRILHLLNTNAFQMTQRLKTYFGDKGIDISVELDKYQSSLFHQFVDKDAYFNLEKENLADLIGAFTARFEQKNEKIVNKHLLENKIMHSKDTNGTVPGEYDQDVFADTPQRENSTRRLLSYKKSKKFTSISKFIKNMERTSSLRGRFTRTKLINGTDTNFKAPVDQLDPDLGDGSEMSLVIAERILKCVVESLTRAIELIPSKINECTLELFDILIVNYGQSYLAVELENLYYNGILVQQQKLSSFFGSSEINLKFLEQINLISVQVYLLSIVIKRFFYPLILSSEIKNRLSVMFNSYLQDVELGLNIIVDELLELIERNMKHILNGQSADDFQPAIQTTNDRTETCDKMLKFVDQLFKSLYTYLSFNPSLKLDVMKRILANLLVLLINHFTRFRVNSIGSLVLTQDVIHYISIFDNYPDTEDMKEQFTILRELSNLYSCQPELLKDLGNEGQLIYLKKAVLKQYISRRSDFEDKFLQGI
ncbi:hypothetical protein OGAPHI_002142 [Ogataea philodendri]|uniref:Exocyst complex component Sec10 n=1 Tax=Ogataea philodendri TaxID=1378263 RepID=A0A9P8T6R6_9ASCO|nr:uncharacterized protein OGAPHI_002142 [Ogataea philodendri]KAH3668388.1 hypothetical protein OGAPHI_002142 [Ogataea philodendri]